MKGFLHHLNTLKNKLPKPENWIFWVSVSLVVKTIFFVVFISLYQYLGDDYAGFNYKGSFAKAGGDVESYFEPIENLLDKGEYFDDIRMPGYGWIYYFLRLFLNKAASFNVIIIIQLIFSAISVYLLGLIAYLLIKKNISFYFAYLLYLISTFVSINDYVLMTESFSASALITSLYFFQLYIKNKHLQFLFYSGLFLTWCIFLKPIIFPILLFLVFIIITDFIYTKAKFLLFAKRIFVLIITFIIIEGLWVYRNYKKYDRVFLFQKSIYYAGYEKGFRNSLILFIKSFGGNIEFWLPSSEVIYFEPESPYFYAKQGMDSTFSLIPEYIYTSKFNKDSLSSVRALIIELHEPNIDFKEREILENAIINKLNTYKASLKNEKWFLYYAGSKLIALKKLIFNSEYGFGYIWKDSINYYWYRIFKLFYSVFYYFIIITGIIGCVFLSAKYLIKFNNLFYPLIIFVLYLTLSYPVLFNESQNRYFVTAYPFILLSGVYVMVILLKTIKNKWRFTIKSEIK